MSEVTMPRGLRQPGVLAALAGLSYCAGADLALSAEIIVVFSRSIVYT